MKKVLLKDIAEHAGVSTALVSYVLNGLAEEKQVNKVTAARIRKSAKKLNYQPNQIAQSLKTSKTNTIGLVVADIRYRYSTGITSVIEAEAKKKNYTVIYGSSNEDLPKFEELVNVFVNRRVDGLILIPVENSQRQIKLLQKKDIPFVLIDRIFPQIPTNYIALDNYKASYDATEYLIRCGHGRIAIVNYKSSLYNLQERNRGYISALKDSGIKLNRAYMIEIDRLNAMEEVNSSIDSILAMDKPCDAIFFTTATLALHGLSYLNEKGLRVPDDISVFSFDESEAFKLFYCPVTHSVQPYGEMGTMAVQALVGVIENQKGVTENQKSVKRQITFDTRMIRGKSCHENDPKSG
jgi:LacI family transcriptional regulator